MRHWNANIHCIVIGALDLRSIQTVEVLTLNASNKMLVLLELGYNTKLGMRLTRTNSMKMSR